LTRVNMKSARNGNVRLSSAMTTPKKRQRQGKQQ
jgi:hypothetical protein